MRRLVTIITALYLLNSSAFSQNFNAQQKQDVIGAIDKHLNTIAYVQGKDFNQWKSMVREHQHELDVAQTKNDFCQVLNNVLSEFECSHLTVRVLSSPNARSGLNSVGIGISVRQMSQGLLITRVIPNAPASKAGLKPGDIIFSANDKAPKTTSDLSGQEGETISLSWLRDGQQMRGTVEIQQFSTKIPESLVWIDQSTSILTIPTFDRNIYDRERVERLIMEASAGDNLIIDMRNNGGGRIKNAGHLLNLLMPPYTKIGTFVSREMVQDHIKGHPGMEIATAEVFAVAAATDQKWQTIPGKLAPFEGSIVVLIDGRSGSASEMATAALQENRNATVIGTISYGGTLMSNYKQLPHGFRLQLPVYDYITIGGKRLEGVGVIPDLKLMPTEETPFVKLEDYLKIAKKVFAE